MPEWLGLITTATNHSEQSFSPARCRGLNVYAAQLNTLTSLFSRQCSRLPVFKQITRQYENTLKTGEIVHPDDKVKEIDNTDFSETLNPVDTFMTCTANESEPDVREEQWQAASFQGFENDRPTHLTHSSAKDKTVSRVSHDNIILTLQSLKTEEITTEIKFITPGFTGGFVRFKPENTVYDFKVFFSFAFKKGMRYTDLKENYHLKGVLHFIEDQCTLKKYVYENSPHIFWDYKLQTTQNKVLNLAKKSIRLELKNPHISKHDTLNKPEKLSPRQTAILDIFSSLYNEELTLQVRKFKKDKLKNEGVFIGTASFEIKPGRCIFVLFNYKIPEDIPDHHYLNWTTENTVVKGRLNYDHHWLLNKILKNEGLFYPLLAIPRGENQLFLAPSSISVTLLAP